MQSRTAENGGGQSLADQMHMKKSHEKKLERGGAGNDRETSLFKPMDKDLNDSDMESAHGG